MPISFDTAIGQLDGQDLTIARLYTMDRDVSAEMLDV